MFDVEVNFNGKTFKVAKFDDGSMIRVTDLAGLVEIRSIHVVKWREGISDDDIETINGGLNYGTYVKTEMIDVVFRNIVKQRIDEFKDVIKQLLATTLQITPVVIPMLGRSLTQIIEKYENNEISFERYVDGSEHFKTKEDRMFFNVMHDNNFNNAMFLICPFLACLLYDRVGSDVYNEFYSNFIIGNSDLIENKHYIDISSDANMVRHYLADYDNRMKGKFLSIPKKAQIDEEKSEPPKSGSLFINNEDENKLENKLEKLLKDFIEYNPKRKYWLFSGSALKRLACSSRSKIGTKMRDYFELLDTLSCEYASYSKHVKTIKDAKNDEELEHLRLTDYLRNEQPNDILFKHKKGKIYIVTTPSRERYHIYKVGITTDIKMRMLLFNANQPKNDQFKCIFVQDCSKIEACEAAIKQELAPFRIKKNPNSEMFRVNLEHITRVVNTYINLSKVEDKRRFIQLSGYNEVHNKLNTNVAPAVNVSVFPPVVNDQAEFAEGVKPQLMRLKNEEIDKTIITIIVELACRGLNNVNFKFMKPAKSTECILTWPVVSEMITHHFDITGKAYDVKTRIKALTINSNINFDQNGKIKNG